MPEGAMAQTFGDHRDRALGTSQVVIRDDPGVELREDEQLLSSATGAASCRRSQTASSSCGILMLGI
jgi:hypothetical protein